MKPSRLTVDTNPDLCNLHCLMCDTHSRLNKNFKPTRKPMPKDLLEKVLDEAFLNGITEIIPSTMGEPIMYPYFEIFLKKIAENKAKLNLTTNGTFPNGGIRFWGRKILDVASDVKVSLNGINPEVNEYIMTGSNTAAVLENIKELTRFRDLIIQEGINNPTITLQVTFLKSNLEDLENIIKFAIENNIDRVKGHHLWITWETLSGESLKKNAQSIETWNSFIEKIEPYRKAIELQNFTKIKAESDNGCIPDSYECPFLGKELWIDYTGNYNVCCAPSKERVQLGNYSNIQDTPMKEVFESVQYRTLLSEYKSMDLCKKCTMRKPK
jgi:MoaA/NifB/PqqE/SkfB family radical SAM enzyme